MNARARRNGGGDRFLQAAGIAIGAKDGLAAGDLQGKNRVEGSPRACGCCEIPAGIVRTGSPPVAVLGATGFAKREHALVAGSAGSHPGTCGKRIVYAVGNRCMLEVYGYAARFS